MSFMETRMENRFDNMEDMMRKLIEMRLKASTSFPSAEPKRKEILEEMIMKLLEMQSKTSLVVQMANSNQDLTKIPLAESKGKEIGRDEFNEESFFHQEPPPRATIMSRPL
ncbi:hypothetical protein IEQ34_010994 [Dendrobium chrysotoxum]|uniref:Uncharacterized protein n=1 Tax=Dendrobium chrysotoxum TaxID=161865 RepID=A0AAV7GUD7_DENCH|nr:hypothetical protein IEQ34_010994 [Dendrobium chrysotoxum]